MLSLNKNSMSKWAIGNSLTPIEGPRIMSFSLDFSRDSAFVLDSQNVIQGAEQFTMVQTVFVDTSSTDVAVIVTVAKSGQQIIIKGRTQGYYPICAPNSWNLQFACADVAAVVPVVLCNYPVSPGIWAATK